MVASCASYDGPPEGWAPELWVGSPYQRGIERKQDGEVFDCRDPRFSDFVCMSWADYITLVVPHETTEDPIAELIDESEKRD